jgi:hypothetical protein
LIRNRDRQVWAELEEFLTENVYVTTESDICDEAITWSGGKQGLKKQNLDEML